MVIAGDWARPTCVLWDAGGWTGDWHAGGGLQLRAGRPGVPVQPAAPRCTPIWPAEAASRPPTPPHVPPGPPH